jgi:hypothetical protein
MSAKQQVNAAAFRIVILEDDPYQAQWVADELWKHAPNAEITYFDSEFSISNAIHTQLKEFRPHLFILDLMVRAYSFSELSDPESIDHDRFPDAWWAGFRIAKQIRTVDAFKDSPIIIWSVMEDPRATEPPLTKTLFFQKNEERALERLTRAVRSVAAAVHEPLPNPKTSRLIHAADAAELKPSFMGMSIDLKKLWKALTGG